MDIDDDGARKSIFPIYLLPAEILSSILGFSNALLAPLSLWQCGSRALHRLLSRAVTKIELVNRKEYAFVHVPVFLSSFRQLETLVIDRKRFGLVYPGQTLQVLQSLPPTIIKLVFRFKNASHLLTVDTYLSSPSASKEQSSTPLGAYESYLDLSSLYPRLESLEFGFDDNLTYLGLESLPDTLTELTAYMKFHDHHPEHMPASLRRLSLGVGEHFPDELLAFLPPHIEELELVRASPRRNLAMSTINSLPRSLKSLKFKQFARQLADGIPTLPPHLTALIGYADMQPCIREHIDALPKHLTELELSMCCDVSPADLLALPRSLTSLTASLTLEHQDHGNIFPPNLTWLKVEVNYYQSGLVFPSTLRFLDVGFTEATLEDSYLQDLPPLLTDLTILGIATVDLSHRFPSHLTSLDLQTGQEISFLPALPESLRRLGLGAPIKVSVLFSLPTRLRDLQIQLISDLEEFDVTHPETLERISLLRKKAQEEGFVADENLPLSSGQERRLGVFDLLPRTLTSLGLDSISGNIETHVCQSIPKKLKKLTFWSIGATLSQEHLDCLPFDSVTDRLTISGSDWRVRHTKRLHDDLKSLEMPYSQNIEIPSPEGVYALPMNMNSTVRDYWGQKVTEELFNLRYKLERALANSDLEAYNKLRRR